MITFNKTHDHPSRRDFLGTSALALASMAMSPELRAASSTGSAGDSQPPNVLLVITDDQGYGDLSCHGNPVLKTPHLDELHDESVRLTQFYACPVCAPTRASLMTGRYYYRTGVVDTYKGRAMMHPDEVTLAETLKQAGYRTGLFGKWHLGDNYPLRAMDQGFEETVVHMGGGIGQPSDPPGNTYFDPILSQNGEEKRYEGYCTDIFTDEAIRFMREHREEPFFTMLATNTPHTPTQVAEKYFKPYIDEGLDEYTAKIYGMIANLDENIGRLTKAVESLGLAQNTVVVFLTDNGANRRNPQERYSAGLRGRKGSVYENGIRVPCFIRWPERLKAGKHVGQIAGVQDLMPTLLDCCGVPEPQDVHLDGTSLLPIVAGEQEALSDRTLFFQWHRGDAPEKFRSCAVRTPRFKLVDGKELYDMHADPGERHDASADHPQVVERLRDAYESWYAEMEAERHFEPPAIHIGTPHESPTVLTRQDWRGPHAGWTEEEAYGYWKVYVARAGRYRIELRFHAVESDGPAKLEVGDQAFELPIEAGAESCTFPEMTIEKGETRIYPWLEVGGTKVGPYYVDVTRLGPSSR